MKNTATICSLFLAAFLALFLYAGLMYGSIGSARRLPNLPATARFQVTAAIVELKPDDSVLKGSTFQTILNDIPKRSEIGLGILDANDASGKIIHTRTTRILKQGDDFSVSYDLPKEMDTSTGADPYLRHATANVHLCSVDTLQTAEFNVTGGAFWYADLMKTNHSTGFGSSIPGYGCFNLGTSNMIPLFVQPGGSAWVLLSVTKVAD